MYTQYTFINKKWPKLHLSLSVMLSCPTILIFMHIIHKIYWIAENREHAIVATVKFYRYFNAFSLGRQRSGWREISRCAISFCPPEVAEFLFRYRRFALPDRAAPVLRLTIIMTSQPAQLHWIFIFLLSPTSTSWRMMHSHYHSQARIMR